MVPPESAWAFGPDDVERRVADVATATAMVDERSPRYAELVADLLSQVRTRAEGANDAFLDKVRGVTLLAYARFAVRHGSWGGDRHAYHNEYHTWEIVHDRVTALAGEAGWGALTAPEWALLIAFAACHDLRQRETGEPENLVGPNERASIDETLRIFSAAGCDRSVEAHAQAMDDMALMIGGSTFETDADSTHVLLPSGGAVAPALVRQLRAGNPDWDKSALLRRRMRLALIASDLDTANVSEPFPVFARSAARLCAEVEMRLGRAALGEDSVQPVLQFLTKGQEYYFFQLHHFDSKLGRQVFTKAKEANAPKVLAVSEHMRMRFAGGRATTGQEIVDAFIARADELG